MPAPVVGIDPPGDLRPAAAWHWRRLATQLQTHGLLTELDVGLFRIYCESWQEKSDCEETLTKEGQYFTTESGFVVQHPAVNRLARALERIRKLGAEFGLSPSARSSLEVGGTKKQGGKLGKYVGDG